MTSDRFPSWGSMSTHRTRNPSLLSSSANAAHVVVFADPPFWFTNATTLALLILACSSQCRTRGGLVTPSGTFLLSLSVLNRRAYGNSS